MYLHLRRRWNASLGRGLSRVAVGGTDRVIRFGHGGIPLPRRGCDGGIRLGIDIGQDRTDFGGLTLLESDFHERARLRCRNLSVHLVR